ncbi:conserved hypothetical protein; putative phosphotransferase [Desulfamplus magnetovallimortis]|uniref:Aminoglycoside phosphotransferase domain-containing protein n=1 Tax=Desulfamplus magnetovallimortis TaxID=1246637 RepID=A0A1W1H7F0_9BACT|nr:phosphotransferase family protein [Desulfamplus magnetovallimortis]SLM28402.1 conserved hypothetical protein; putative phosphotransferase [Desulfamplus magnetovallimortis]
MTLHDEAVKVRSGEELDIDAVKAFLMENVDGLSGELTVEQYPGGFSNLTYLLRMGDKEMVLRRPPVGAKIKAAHDMVREYRILSAIYPNFPYCPKPLACSDDESIIGAPFYVMEKFSGIILRRELPDGLVFSREDAKQLCCNLIDLHLEIHSIDVKSSGLDFIGKPEGYIGRQVEGWAKRYRNAKTPDAPEFEVVISWLVEKMQPDTDKPSLIHNDYKFDNVVLNPAKPVEITGVLDWEMTTYGDPLMDLGSSLAYWVEKRDPLEWQLMKSMPTDMDGAMTRKEIIAMYGEKSGRNMEKFDFYECFGLFRLAVIAQQIYKRFYEGFTKDKRFGNLIHGVRILENRALTLIEKSKL